ncbi:unnamed protein product [Toxocara canis]|uniref:Secretory carrier-associated membrane protein n=1 Tax=Toxocara canis TaxID=6265 RepID=A0A183UMQ9_TOXCA|nr:unnamed protein product [Toxocara canis]
MIEWGCLMAVEFEDPSVQQAATRPAADPSEDFNPFAQNSRPAAAQSAPASNAQTAAPTSGAMSNDELFRRQEELERKAQELRRREQELERQQREGAAGVGSNRPHNWPPIPSFLPIQPCFYQVEVAGWMERFAEECPEGFAVFKRIYFLTSEWPQKLFVESRISLQDIEVEIPVQFQRTVTLVYYVFLTYVLALTVNVVASLFFMLFGGGGVGIFLLAVIQLLLFSPCSFLFWFRPVYKAFRNDSSFNFMVFFFVLFFHTIFTLVQALGLSQYACGWANSIETFHVNVFVALLMLISALVFTAAFAGMVFSLIRVHRLYRGAGFSIDKARKEFSDGVMADRNVQQGVERDFLPCVQLLKGLFGVAPRVARAASGAARAAATHAAAQAMNQTTQGRY